MRGSLRERLYGQVEVRGPDDCWPWKGYRIKGGYGLIRVGDAKVPASRVALALELGRDVLPGYDACHTCDHGWCCNPNHLYEGTRQRNVQDCVERGRRAPRTGENNGRAKLTWALVRTMRAEYAAGGVTHQELADKYEVTKTVAGNIIRGKLWRE